MSTSSRSITSDGIGKVPIFYEVDGNDFASVQLGDKTFEFWQLYHDDNCIACEEHVSWNEFNEFVNMLLEMFPNKEFEYHSYCHDGYGITLKCGIIDGEYKEWDIVEASVYDGLEEDCSDEDDYSADDD